MMAVLAGVTTVVAVLGLADALVASWLVAAFAARRPAPPAARPKVTVLKPLHGDEPLLEAALTSLCLQDYPDFQIVFGVGDAADPAVGIARRLRERFADLDTALVIDPTQHGRNRKVGNLINMMAAARHDVLVIADADIHVRPDYLDRLVARLQQPNVGLVTTLYAGLPVLPRAVVPRTDAPQHAVIAHPGVPQAGAPRAGAPRGEVPAAVMPRAAAPQAMMPPAGDAATPAGTAGQAVGTGEQRADGPGASRREPPQHGTSQPGTSQLGTSQRGMPQYGMSQYGTPRYGAAESGSWWSGLPARLGAMHITQGFLPGAVLARSLGRQDCLGATMCLRRQDLERIGGLGALVDHLADDNVLGRRIAGIGLHVALAETLTLTTVPEDSFRALWRHELRWARTIRALEPAGFAASILRHPLAWALLTVLLSGGALWSIGLFFVAWMLRAIAALIVDGALARQWSRRPEGPGRESDAAGSGEMTTLAFSCPVWLLPLRDVLSVAALFASYGGRHVHWRGHGLHADTPPRSAPQPVTSRP